MSSSPSTICIFFFAQREVKCEKTKITWSHLPQFSWCVCKSPSGGKFSHAVLYLKASAPTGSTDWAQEMSAPVIASGHKIKSTVRISKEAVFHLERQRNKTVRLQWGVLRIRKWAYQGKDTSKKAIKDKNMCEKCLHVGTSIKRHWDIPLWFY